MPTTVAKKDSYRPHPRVKSTQKAAKFCSGPVGEKPIEKLPGVGKAVGGQLRQLGFDKVG